MTKKCKCYDCGREFNSKTRKKEHKRLGCKEDQMEDLKTEEKVERKSPIQKIAKILVPKEQAKEEWKTYCNLLKKRKDKHLKIMKEAMYHAKQGKKFIDVYEAINKAGLNSKGEPRLAISRADLHEVFFEKKDTGSGSFLMGNEWNRRDWNTDVHLPQKTFKVQWERLEKDDGTPSWGIKDKQLKAKVPIIPALLMPEGDLKNYYVLWEVKTWEQLPETKDPFLLKRISENLFVVLGAWDVTELERAIIGGLK